MLIKFPAMREGDYKCLLLKSNDDVSNSIDGFSQRIHCLEFYDK